MGKRDISHAGIEHFHENCQHHREGHQPRVGLSVLSSSREQMLHDGFLVLGGLISVLVVGVRLAVPLYSCRTTESEGTASRTPTTRQSHMTITSGTPAPRLESSRLGLGIVEGRNDNGDHLFHPQARGDHQMVQMAILPVCAIVIADVSSADFVFRNHFLLGLGFRKSWVAAEQARQPFTSGSVDENVESIFALLKNALAPPSHNHAVA